MNKLIRMLTVLAASGMTTMVVAADRVGDFALIDHLGTFHHMAWYDDQQAVVLMVQSNGAPEVAAAMPAFNALAAQYKEQSVVFMLLNPGTQNRQAVHATWLGLRTDLPVLMDDTQLVTEALGLKHIAEAVIYNPRTFEVVYRGPVQDHLEPALKKFLAGEAVEMVASNGTLLEFPTLAKHQNQVPSYEKEVAPILAEKCASCHRAGGIAPFALDSHLAAQGWSPMIKEVVMTKRMPPGQVDNKVGHRLKGEMNLEDADIQTLVHWVNAGSPVDGTADPLAALTWPDSKWVLGEPDLIVQIPPQSIPATGIVDYMDIPVDLNLDRDVWIKGSVVVPGEPSVLHHIITTVVPPEGAPDFMEILNGMLADMPEAQAQEVRAKLFAAATSGERPDIGALLASLPGVDVGAFIGGSADRDQASVAGYAPGVTVAFEPEGTGGLLRAGTTLNLQMHYTTAGKETVDASEIGIYFYPEGEIPTERMSGGVGNAFSINIPSQAKDHEMEITTVVPKDAYIYSLMPHMHFRGKRMEFKAIYPDGSQEMLVSVPNYSFNWQLSHTLETPLLVPAGTKIVATGAFDNSSQNAFNPDPNIAVQWGEQSWEEMFMGFYNWKYVDQSGGD